MGEEDKSSNLTRSLSPRLNWSHGELPSLAAAARGGRGGGIARLRLVVVASSASTFERPNRGCSSILVLQSRELLGHLLMTGGNEQGEVQGEERVKVIGAS